MGKFGSRLSNAVVLMVAVLAGGTMGYHLIEGWGYFDSFYMTVITVSMVGFREVRQMSHGGRMLTLGIIIMGVGMVAYAGASNVISPQAIGARRAAYILVKPHVSDFIDVATGAGNLELVIDQVDIRQDSAFAGRSLQESDLRRQTGLVVLAIKRSDGRMLFNPPPDSILEVGDTLVTVGGQQGDDALHPEN